uniref:Uncharacterized protein n=1 Tax=Aegilops tauschii TaxID=37682 RepID=M8CPP2_AEGTA
MEQFQDGHHVRLRSRERGTYLHADDDGLGVSLHHRRASMNTAWAVHIYQGDGNNQYVLLHSAAYGRYLGATDAPAPRGHSGRRGDAYGRYLGATDAPAPRGHSGRRVEQCDYEPWEEMAIRWQVVRIGSGDDILLRQVAGRLRANGKYLSVDGFNSAGPMMHWVVERIPAREDTRRLAAPTGLRFPRSLAFLLPWRVIQSEQAGADEPNANFAWASLVFRGRSAFHLRKKLARRLDAAMDACNLVMCVRAGTHGRPTPLLVDLPHSDETLDIVVVMAGTPAHADLRYPNVNAE